MSEHCCSGKGRELERLAAQAEQRRVLQTVLVINAVLFFPMFGADVCSAMRWSTASAFSRSPEAIAERAAPRLQKGYFRSALPVLRAA